MISYFDETRNGLGPIQWTDSEHRLSDMLLSIGSEFGDETHTSGPIDYLIRFLVNETDMAVREGIRNYFLVVVGRDGITVVSKIGDEQPSLSGLCSFEESWVDTIVDRFRVFRQGLG